MGCGKQPEQTMSTCSTCGEPRPTATAPPSPVVAAAREHPLWSAAVTSLVLGAVCVLALLDDAEWDSGTAAGMALFSVVGLVLGLISLGSGRRGKAMAVAGIVMSVIGLLVYLGIA